MEKKSVLEQSVSQGESNYPSTGRRETVHFDESKIKPVSGSYDGKLVQKTVGQASLDVKLDVDKMKEFSPVLNIVSGTVTKSSGKFFCFGEQTALYFRSYDGEPLTIKRQDEKSFEINCGVLLTRSDGKRFDGEVHIQLRFRDQKDWHGSFVINVDTDKVTFDIARTSRHFRQVAIDVDYVDEVVWPSLNLGEYHDISRHLKGRTMDPFVAFDDAGVKLIYDAKGSDKLADPSPHTPWTKNDMYDLMMTHLDQHPGSHDTLWCMMAHDPPDYRYMGYSFDKNENHGFGLFMNHKSFEGLRDSSHENFIYAKRKFLHYFIHECGHSLGLHHSFDLGKPNELSWMNYAWRYDSVNGPGKFYRRFNYSFTETEIKVIRHSPNKHFTTASNSNIHVFNYGAVKTVPGDLSSRTIEEEEDSSEPDVKLSLRIKVRKEPFQVNELVGVEVRIKNEGMVPAIVERDLSIESGHLKVYITYPDGNVKNTKAFVHPISGTSYSKPLLLYPGDDGMDRHTQLISVGEGNYGADFHVAGQYHLQAVYLTNDVKVSSNVISLTVEEGKIETEKGENVAFALGTTSHAHTKPIQQLWNKIISLGIAEKKLQLSKIISISDEVATKVLRVSLSSGYGPGKIVKTEAAAITPEEFLNGTEDLLEYCHTEGMADDNLIYKELVMARVKVSFQVNEEKADQEFGLMIADLIVRGVKYSAIKSIMQEFEELKTLKDKKVKDAAYYQKRIEDILNWFPDKRLEKKEDLSGLGLNVTVSAFIRDHVVATSKIVQLIFNKLEETNDLDEVIDYADNLQKSFQVNHTVLHWAVEILIVHCPLAKKNGIMYPLPPDKDESLEVRAAMVEVDRSGSPREEWINYWRNDGDLNYHHRHWHSVYVGVDGIDRLGRWRVRRPELEKQGELFAYMHQQMLARYDCERKSWGLNYVRAWDFDDNDPHGYNAGFEFHSHPSTSDFATRPSGSWPSPLRKDFRNWEEEYKRAVEDGVLPSVNVGGNRPLRLKMDFNLAGHVIEASSSLWRRDIGSIHNQGHVVFATNNLRGSSYMISTSTAMRDPIFYRWHKYVDNLWQTWNNTQVIQLKDDAPPVLIRSNDILMRKSADQLNGFASFQSESFKSDEMTTFLGPPVKRFERDNKISHDPFFYHIRFKRTSPGDLNLTFRIFICPEREVNNRQMWIEMDKFVYRLSRDQDTGFIVRSDLHSSVIKRNPSDMQGDVEAPATRIVDGHCECGWPYSMLLPRGTAEGEKWKVCVFVSNNDIDSIAVRSSCGSMSFCGARNQQYPDQRPMGYPFTTAISVGEEERSITEAMDLLTNAAISDFVIRNNVETSSPTDLVDVWTAWDQLGLDDGTLERDIRDYKANKVLARLRILVDEDISKLNRTGRISVRFQGRGSGNGAYRVSNATVALRNENSLNIVPRSEVSVLTVQGESSFDVPEYGVITDEITISRQAHDLFVTFTLLSPGCHLKGERGGSISTWAIFNPREETATSENWNDFGDVKTSSSIYCVGSILSPLPR